MRSPAASGRRWPCASGFEEAARSLVGAKFTPGPREYKAACLPSWVSRDPRPRVDAVVPRVCVCSEVQPLLAAACDSRRSRQRRGATPYLTSVGGRPENARAAAERAATSRRWGDVA